MGLSSRCASLRAMASRASSNILSALSFDIKASTLSENGLRLGRLSMPGRAAMDTPHYVAVSSRGAVPHISPDMMRNETSLKSMYTALEDCEYDPPNSRCMFQDRTRTDKHALPGACKI